MKNKIKSSVLGFVVGDALGVPYEFLKKSEIPATIEMCGYGTHNQPVGSWSDDSSLMLTTLESLALHGFDSVDIGQRFVNWFYGGYWTPHGIVFDVGFTTRDAIERIFKKKAKPALCGGFQEKDNGNGSLMRILPLVFHLYYESNIEKRWKIISELSSITHGHIRSIIGCFYYVEFGIRLLDGEEKWNALKNTNFAVQQFLYNKQINPEEISKYKNLFNNDFSIPPHSSGYVVSSLYVALYCLLFNDNFEDSLIFAIKLGYDTDTNAALVGGLAGIIYGEDNIPNKWVQYIVKRKEIESLIELYSKSLT